VTIDRLHEAIKDLREELRRIDYAISAVEGVLQGKAPRGRPPKFVAKSEAEAAGRPPGERRRPRRQSRQKSPQEDRRRESDSESEPESHGRAA